ncbi:FAD-binding oxidoreductase [Rathayibacter festucae]|uniref:NAD(P)/FAD-dependent oxidoreductase n=1 Tax=Rathayibacter festucae TaxID=110937 RepID=UPI001FB2B943|nr:FAD-binding oxidoreductase [Rathayibacter festucae]MCJ1702099.1 FAD-binding oxidoreductase [Rathayibacter festucae]
MKQKIIVIGAGVIGSALASELTRRGAAVTVIDAAEVGSGTSSATFAWINANDKAPHEYGYLNYLGLQAHERAAARGGRWFHQTGMIQVAQTEDEAAGYEQNIARVSWEGYGARRLTRAEVLDLEPALDPTRPVSGVFYPKEGWVDVQTMCLSLIDRALEDGATFSPFETVTGIKGTRVTTASVDGATKTYDGDLVILASGNGNRKILRSIDIDFPVLDPEGNVDSIGTPASSLGIISTTGRVASGIRHFVRANGIALRPARNGGITFADHPTGGSWAPGDPGVWSVPEVLLERARQLYPSLTKTTTESVSLGTRVLPEDGLTIADWVTNDHSIYAVATHSGVTLAAHLAETVAEEVLSGRRHDSLEPFGLSRFATA